MTRRTSCQWPDSTLVRSMTPGNPRRCSPAPAPSEPNGVRETPAGGDVSGRASEREDEQVFDRWLPRRLGEDLEGLGESALMLTGHRRQDGREFATAPFGHQDDQLMPMRREMDQSLAPT